MLPLSVLPLLCKRSNISLLPVDLLMAEAVTPKANSSAWLWLKPLNYSTNLVGLRRETSRMLSMVLREL